MKHSTYTHRGRQKADVYEEQNRDETDFDIQHVFHITIEVFETWKKIHTNRLTVHDIGKEN